MDTAPREIANTPTTAKEPERKIIQKSHLLKVQRDINQVSAISGQQPSICDQHDKFAFLAEG
jgi:hypothetical protein